MSPNGLAFKGNIIWTSTARPVMPAPVEYILFANKVEIDFCYIFFSVIEDTVLIETMRKKCRSPCSFNRKQAFISVVELSLRELFHVM